MLPTYESHEPSHSLMLPVNRSAMGTHEDAFGTTCAAPSSVDPVAALRADVYGAARQADLLESGSPRVSTTPPPRCGDTFGSGTSMSSSMLAGCPTMTVAAVSATRAPSSWSRI